MSTQCLVTAYHMRNASPTTVENSTLIEELMNRSLSRRTFSSIDKVSPLLLSSYSSKESRRVFRRPSLKISIPSVWTTSSST